MKIALYLADDMQPLFNFNHHVRDMCDISMDENDLHYIIMVNC